MADQTFSDYATLPLPTSIRLLTVLPGSGQSIIKCNLEEVDLSKNPLYEALSYAWGDPKPSKEIICNGLEAKIAENLGTALQYIRQPQQSRILWVDALCINQTDDSERSHQVSFMRDIYEKATRTLIWLGEEDASTVAALNLIRRAAQLNDSESGKIDMESSGIVTAKENRRFGFPDFDDWQWTAVSELLRREWFSRLWIVQEVTVSSNALVLIGRHSCDWITVVNACVLLLGLNYDATLVGMKSALSRIVLFRLISSSRTRNLFQIILFTNRQIASDKRDAFFAVVGLSCEWQKPVICPLLLPDYNKTFQQVCIDVGRHYLGCTFCSAVLDVKYLESLVHRKSTLPENHPSWAPSSSDGFVNYFGKKFTASLDTPAFQSSLVDAILKLRGIFVNTIVVVDDSLHGEASLLCRWRQVKHLWMSYAAKNGPYVTGETVDDVFCQTITGLTISDNQNDSARFASYCRHHLLPEASATRRRGFLARLRNILSATPPAADDFIMPSTPPSKMSTFQPDAFASAIQHTIFFSTDSGHMGISHAEVQTGDKIVVLLGAYMPFVLRPQGDQYVFRGCCYVHGLMKGEAIHEMRAGKLKEEWIEIV